MTWGTKGRVYAQGYGGGSYYPPPMPMQPRRSSGLATAGGALILVAAVFGIIFGIYFIWAGSFLGSFYDPVVYGEAPSEEVSTVLYVCGSILFIFSIIALAGGISAITKKSWGLAILGGVFSLFTIGFIIGSILGLIGLILVAVSRDDFLPPQPAQVIVVQAPAPPPMYQPPAAQEMRMCQGCGRQIPVTFNNCPQCGRAAAPPPPPPPKQ